jgi:hypothetical protein
MLEWLLCVSVCPYYSSAKVLKGFWLNLIFVLYKKKLRGFGPLANYGDRATAACWRSSANFLRIEGVAWSAQRIPPLVSLDFLDRSRYFFLQVAPQLSSRGWVDTVPDPLLLRKSGSAGNPTRELWICSQKLWPLGDTNPSIHITKLCKREIYCYRSKNFMNEGYVVGHVLERSIMFQCVVSILWAIIIFLCGYVKRSMLYKGNCLRFTVCACYSWEMALNVGLDASFDKM